MWRFVAVASVIGFAVTIPYNIEIDEPEGEDLTYLGTDIFGDPKESSGKKLEQWNENSGVNPEEVGEYAEGDILFPGSAMRNGIIDKARRWEGGVIPYEISKNFTREQIKTIKKAMKIFHMFTCVRFRKRKPSDHDYVSIVNNATSCWSSVGKKSGKQFLNLHTPQCLKRSGTVMHELMHTIGFTHEQSRWERDRYVIIQEENIKNGSSKNFVKKSKDEIDGFGVPYDVHSVMHYSSKAASKNGKPTILPKDPNVDPNSLGQRGELSKSDIIKINIMYKCHQTSTATR